MGHLLAAALSALATFCAGLTTPLSSPTSGPERSTPSAESPMVIWKLRLASPSTSPLARYAWETESKTVGAYQKLAPLPTKPGNNLILGHPSDVLVPFGTGGNKRLEPPGLTYSTKLEITPTLGETWNVTGIAFQLYVSYESDFYTQNKVAAEKLEAQLASANEDVGLRTEIYNAGGKTKELAITVHEAARVVQQIEREKDELGIEAGETGIRENPAVNVAALVRQAGGIVWIAPTLTPKRSLIESFPTEHLAEGRTEVRGLWVDTYESRDGFPLPAILYAGEQLTFEVQFYAANQGAAVNGVKLGNAAEPLQPRYALPTVQVSYDQIPLPER